MKKRRLNESEQLLAYLRILRRIFESVEKKPHNPLDNFKGRRKKKKTGTS